MNKLKVGIISDIHIPAAEPSEKNLYNALSILKERKAELIIFSGDIVNSAEDSYYDIFNNIVDDVFKKDIPEMLFVMGNHDYWTDYWISDSNAPKKFMEKLNLKNIDSHITKKGFYFISISPQFNYNGDQRLDEKVFYDAIHGGYEHKILWLKNEIEKAIKQSSDKPIFVISHYPPSFTLPGSYIENGRHSNDALADLFKNYPQIISISGHTHFPLADERAIHQRNFTSICASSLYCLGCLDIEIPDEQGKLKTVIPIKVKPADAYRKYPTFIYFEVDERQVIFERLYAENGSKCGKDWIINYPIKKDDFAYTDKRFNTSVKPYFNKNTLIKKIDNIKGNLTIMFGSANYEIKVAAYKYLLTNSNKKIINQDIFYSEIDDNILNKQKYYYIKFNNMEKGNYAIQIFAIDSFGNYSENSLTLNFNV